MPLAVGSILVRPARRFRGRITVPGDKSISHRYALLAALAQGTSRIANFAPGEDCRTTVSCLEALGVRVEAATPAILTVIGRGARGLSSPAAALDARNSGTTTRLLAGILAAHPFSTVIRGDASLSARPMRRVAVPLTRMGATILLSPGDRLPMTVTGGALHAIDYQTEAPSAQVKSSVLLAGLQAKGTTRVTESHQTRDHTERALRLFGVAARVSGTSVELEGGQPLQPIEAAVPGDLSSAAFWLAAAAAVPGGGIEIHGVGLNPTRTALLDVLQRAGAQVEVIPETGSVDQGVEISGTVRIRHAGALRLSISPAEVPGLIDELPALAAAATFGGECQVTGAGELRVKESDRITSLVKGIRALGGRADERPDGFVIDGTRPPEGGVADAAGDHRLAMAFAVTALGARGPSTILGAGAVDVSYPGFFDTLRVLTS